MNPDWNVEHPAFLDQVDTALAVFGTTRRDMVIESEFKDLVGHRTAYDPLPVVHLAMVDDERWLLEQYVPGLIYVTRGAASQILFQHKKEGIDSIQRRVALINPDVVLMDYRLNKDGNPPYGTEVIPLLRKLSRKMLIIGFSSNADNKDKFMSAGADGFVRKGSPFLALPKLRQLLFQLSPLREASN